MVTTVTPTNIIPRVQAAAIDTTQYTSTNVKTVITKMTVTNTTAGAETISINLVANGDSVGDDNLILDTKTVQPGQTYLCPELVGQVLESGGFISTIASAGASLTISASGNVIS